MLTGLFGRTASSSVLWRILRLLKRRKDNLLILHTIQTPILLSLNISIVCVDSDNETMNPFQKAKLYDRNAKATVAFYLPIMISGYNQIHGLSGYL